MISKIKWKLVFEYRDKHAGLWEKTVEATTKEEAMATLQEEIPQAITIIRIQELMQMSVPKGTKIRALDENKILISEGDWPSEASSVIDFSARYADPVYGNRGFRYADKDKVWVFA